MGFYGDTKGYSGLQGVTGRYRRHKVLPEVREVTKDYRGLRGGYKGLKGVTRGYKGLQGLQEVTGGYKG